MVESILLIPKANVADAIRTACLISDNPDISEARALLTVSKKLRKDVTVENKAQGFNGFFYLW